VKGNPGLSEVTSFSVSATTYTTVSFRLTDGSAGDTFAGNIRSEIPVVSAGITASAESDTASVSTGTGETGGVITGILNFTVSHI